MSYSRWSGSNWYIFWDAASSDEETRDGQGLAIWYVNDKALPSYSYRELKDDREKAWHDISTRLAPDDRETFDYSIERFLEDVDHEYPEEERLTKSEDK